MSQTLTSKDYNDAFTEVSFLLEILCGSVHELMGGAGASIGRLAGRHAARQFPLHLPDPDLPAVLSALARYLGDAFQWNAQIGENGAAIEFQGCVLREVCRGRGVEPGGVMCRLTHQYLDGVVNELLGRRVKTTVESAGETCRANLEVR